ncbi:MAG: Ig-like domain-containing protein [Bacteroidales bacterium]|nr:Ig-like domain-containing protein [Bacteroidales bacterium]
MAAATDNSNSRTISDPVTVIVEKAAPAVNQLPSVTISPPINNGTVTSPALITLTAIASRPGRSVVNVVEISGDRGKIGETSTPPYSCSIEFDKEGI